MKLAREGGYARPTASNGREVENKRQPAGAVTGPQSQWGLWDGPSHPTAIGVSRTRRSSSSELTGAAACCIAQGPDGAAAVRCRCDRVRLARGTPRAGCMLWVGLTAVPYLVRKRRLFPHGRNGRAWWRRKGRWIPSVAGEEAMCAITRITRRRRPPRDVRQRSTSPCPSPPPNITSRSHITARVARLLVTDSRALSRILAPCAKTLNDRGLSYLG